MGVKRRFTKRIPKKNTLETSCSLCDSHSNEPYLGQLLCQSDFYVHENCLFFSPVLNQELDPSTKKRGYILGFKISEIQQEVKRINRLKCTVCKEKKAGIGCCKIGCRKSFHLVCGLKHNAMGIFVDTFQFYCHEHAIHQDVRSQVALCKLTVPECTICLELALAEDHDADGSEDDCTHKWDSFLEQIENRQVVHGMCCPRSWMHRTCISRYGLSAGLHHVKCPNCGNTGSFVGTVQKCGIWLPDRDASWELEPGAFQEMYEDEPDITDEDPAQADTDVDNAPEEPAATADIIPVATSHSPTPPAQLPPDTNDENENPNCISPSSHRSMKTVQTDIRKYICSPTITGASPSQNPSNQIPQQLQQQQKKVLSRKRACQSDLPIIPMKRRRKSKDKVIQSSPLLHRQCSRCSRTLVCFSCISKRVSGGSSSSREVRSRLIR